VNMTNIKRIRKWSAAILGLTLLAGAAAAAQTTVRPSPAPPRTANPEPTFDEIAALLAGLPGETPSLAAVRNSAAWKQYAEAIDKNWADLEAKRLKPMRAWADKQLFRARTSSKFLFYPFGGPDFLTAYEFFPLSESFVLMGLEFCGRLPRPDLWKEHQGEAYLKNFSNSLSDFFDKSYFITKHMDETIYGQAQVEGVLPLLSFFLKRTGHRIIDIGRIEFDAKGQAVDLGYDKQKKASRPYGLKILFSASGSAQVKSIVYISANLENKVFAKESALYQHLGRYPAGLTTYVKSASYLMHYATFTHIRDIVLDKSQFILEDDTGIPYKIFKPKDWRVQLYGEYAKPIKDFSGVDQPELKKAYDEEAAIIEKLPYHLGYHWKDNRDALLLIEKKK
jgi:hypothetical protein